MRQPHGAICEAVDISASDMAGYKYQMTVIRDFTADYGSMTA